MSPIPDIESESDDNKPTESENLSAPDLIIPPDPDSPEEDEDDDDSNPYLGYVPLSQDPTDSNLADTEDNGDGDNDGTTTANTTSEQTELAATGISNSNLCADLSKEIRPSFLQVPDLPKPDRKSILWNQTRHESDIQLGQEQEAKIKAAMAGFQLPTSNIPDWARELSDDEWKAKLVSKISVDCLSDSLDCNSSSADSGSTNSKHNSKS